MALRHAVLAALLEGEASGYELAKRFDVSVANFWSATPQQLYRELERLEADGLVRGRVVEQLRRPNKRVFTLTAAGRAELHDFVARPARPTAIRDDLLVKLQARRTTATTTRCGKRSPRGWITPAASSRSTTSSATPCSTGATRTRTCATPNGSGPTSP